MFEGIDGSGKGTQLALLRDHLLQGGLPVSSYREPGGTKFGESVRSILKSPDSGSTPKSDLLLFTACRSVLMETVIIPDLEAGKIVLMDRFIWSTIAYQGKGYGLDSDFIGKLNEFATMSVMPDLTIFLDIPEEEANRRMHKRGQVSSDKFDSELPDFFKRVKSGYRECREMAIFETGLHSWKTIDGVGLVEEISERVKEAVNWVLVKKGYSR